MQTFVRSDRHTPVDAEWIAKAKLGLVAALRHFGTRITRVNVHLSDENSSQKTTRDDTKCVLEARVAGLQPVAVEHRDLSIERAFAGATNKLHRKLKRLVGRLKRT